MKLSWREEFLLRRIGAGLERDDPALARRLAAFTVADEEPAMSWRSASWRPARCAVVVLSVALAAAVLLLTLAVLAFRPPCTGAATARPDASMSRAATAAGTAAGTGAAMGGTRAVPQSGSSGTC